MSKQIIIDYDEYLMLERIKEAFEKKETVYINKGDNTIHVYFIDDAKALKEAEEINRNMIELIEDIRREIELELENWKEPLGFRKKFIERMFDMFHKRGVLYKTFNGIK